jgi:competence protein ComGC
VSEEHRALITLLPYDIIITISALSVLLLTFISFVQRSSARICKTLAVLTVVNSQASQRKRI